MKIYRYRRILALLAIGGVLTVGGFELMEDTTPATHEITYYVKPGDTLWQIASENITEDENILSKIHEIKEQNNLQGTLSIGQELKINKKIDPQTKAGQ